MTKNGCEDYYEGISKITSGAQQRFYEWVLKNGIPFKGRQLTKEEQSFLQKKISKKLFTPKMCVLQSQMGCLDGDLRYFEGQATTKIGIPLAHSWLVDKEGNVWDATWNDGADYFGVEIPTRFVREAIQKTGEASFLLGNYYRHLHDRLSDDKPQNKKMEEKEK